MLSKCVAHSSDSVAFPFKKEGKSAHIICIEDDDWLFTKKGLSKKELLRWTRSRAILLTVSASTSSSSSSSSSSSVCLVCLRLMQYAASPISIIIATVQSYYSKNY